MFMAQTASPSLNTAASEENSMPASYCTVTSEIHIAWAFASTEKRGRVEKMAFQATVVSRMLMLSNTSKIKEPQN